MGIDKKVEYNIKYAKEKLKRIPLDVQKDKYEEIKTAADVSSQAVNTYIKQAIDMRMKSEGFLKPDGKDQHN